MKAYIISLLLLLAMSVCAMAWAISAFDEQVHKTISQELSRKRGGGA
jgi:hypothetical protein